jgi:small-conductance mechanosensitive channel
MYDLAFFKLFLFNNKIELLILVISILIGYFVYYRLKRVFPTLANDKSSVIKNDINLHFTSSLANLLSIQGFLTLGSLISNLYSGSSHIINFIAKILFIALLCKLSKNIITKQPFTKVIINMIIIPVILMLCGIFDKFTKLADQKSIMIGDFNLSIFFIIKAIYIGVFLVVLAKIISKFSEKVINHQQGWSTNTKAIIIKLSNILLYSILFFSGLNILGINLTALTVFSGALGVGVGLSLQKISSNFLSGLILLFEKSINVDDIIECQNGVIGKVKYLGARTTIINDFNGGEVVLPNDELINSKIINWDSEEKLLQISILINVSAEINPEQIKELLIKAAASHAACQNDLKPNCIILNLRRNIICYKLEFWAKTANSSVIKSDVISLIWKIFSEQEIKFS